MTGQVMVPLDGSTLAEQALPLALVLARSTKRVLHLVRVRASLPFGGEDGAEEKYLAMLAEQLEPELPDRITHRVLTNELGALDYPPPPSTVVAEVLARHATEHDAALVVMTTHGRSGFRRAWLGSIADSLIRIAPRPVLVVRPENEIVQLAAAEHGIQHIVVPLDGSEEAEQALPWAQQLGDIFGARYSLVRVISPFAWQMTTGGLGAPVVHAATLGSDAALAYLESIAARLREQHFLVATQVLYGGSPAPAILDYAARNAADLIVMSTAGAGGVRRLLLGSVADKIIRSGEMPVLVCNVRHLDVAAPALAVRAPLAESLT